MTDTLVVLLEEAVAGTLTRLPGGRLRFDYDDEYRARANATPLSVSMPTQVRSHANRAVAPWLWGLLPDNEAVLARWAREFHASASSPFSLLATPIGHDCAGAVRFAAPDAVAAVIGRPGDVTWLTDDEVARRLRDLREDATAWLGREFTGQFSLAGAQAKTALLHQDGRWGVPTGATATTHILKPAVAGLDDHDLNEHLCLAGTDAHAKNYSLLLASGQVRLAPLYDVASTLPYGTHEKKLRFAMKIGGDYRVFPYRDGWPAAAKDLGLEPDRAVQRVIELAEQTADAFSGAASAPEVAPLERSLPARLVDLIAARVERCLALVRRPPSTEATANSQ